MENISTESEARQVVLGWSHLRTDDEDGSESKNNERGFERDPRERENGGRWYKRPTLHHGQWRYKKKGLILLKL